MRIYCRWSLGESTALEYILSWCFKTFRPKPLPMHANVDKGMLCLSPAIVDPANESVKANVTDPQNIDSICIYERLCPLDERSPAE